MLTAAEPIETPNTAIGGAIPTWKIVAKPVPGTVMFDRVKRGAGIASAYGNEQGMRTPVLQFYRKRPPMVPPTITRTHGAIFQNCEPLNKITASEKLFGESIALVQIG